MSLSERERDFLEQHRSAAMATLRADGSPHVVRVGVAVVDGKVWSSGTRSRARTRHLRRDPRATLFVFDDRWRGLSLVVLRSPRDPATAFWVARRVTW